MPIRYVILGMGYVSNKHIQAIKNTCGELVAYHDIHDVVGHVDSKFINARYYSEFIHFDCFVDRHPEIDYAVILLPNHLHNPACRWAMTKGLNVIVEKPITLHERNLFELLDVEERTGKKVNTILQMRLHNSATMLREATEGKESEVNICYHTPRGPWFKNGSWKADRSKSGGLATSIGIHLFDLCQDVFGDWTGWEIKDSVENEYIKGILYCERAVVNFDLSVEADKPMKREFVVNGVRYDFTNGFGDLHTLSYEKILNGEGFGVKDAQNAIRLVEDIRNAGY